MVQRSRIQVIVFGLLSIALVFGFIILSKPKASRCTETYRQDNELKISGQIIPVQTATSATEQSLGLGGRKCIGERQGMLFVFDKSGYYPFWMKDMKFAIDIIWIDSRNNVVDIQQNVQPSSYPRTYVNQSPAKKVLEMPAGSVRTMNIISGTHIN